jgi:GNAT superfamily N-acetyltransferase
MGFLIRTGEPRDEEMFVKAMRDSGHLFAAIWGPRHADMVRQLFRTPGTLYSPDLTLAAEIDGTTVCVHLAWSGAEARRRGEATRKAMRRFLGWRYYLRLGRLAVANRALGTTAPHEFYYANIGVDARTAARLPVPREVRAEGIGKLVMERSLDDGRRAGCTIAYSHVAEGNSPAVAVFHKCGFREVGKSPPFLVGDERFVFLRMERAL